MSRPKKHQHRYPTDRAVATAGMIRGPYIPYANNWWSSFAGLSDDGLATYKDGYMDSPTDRDSDDSGASGEPASATGSTGATAGTV